MPTKILTDQPQAVRKTLQVLVTTSWATFAEPPIFSVPLDAEDVATVDPDDAERELRQGEWFFATGLQIAKNTATARTVDIEMIGETGVTTVLAPALLVPAYEVLTLAPGLSIFKEDLDAPTDAGMTLRIKASANSALTLTASVVERERLQHSPDTETV